MLGRGGKTWLASPASAGTLMWRGIVRILLTLCDTKKAITVMVVGDTDVGKSTLSTYIANLALDYGFVPCVVDGDIGQGDLAPPGAIGAAVLSGQVTDLRDVCADLFEFVGDISPAGIEGFVATRLGSIIGKARRTGDICIVNTDGYVRAGGIAYKLMVATVLRPDAIICLGKNPGMVDALEDGAWRVLPARSSSQASKSRAERTKRRLDQFLRYTGKGSCSLGLEQIKFEYVNRVSLPLELSQQPIKHLALENMKGMFVGLGSNNRVSGFGVITNIDLDSIHVQTDRATFNTIYLSNMRLSTDGAEEIIPS
jgi:polynucleotide 5'-hydroxyl-kinase GRC3/NOL9